MQRLPIPRRMDPTSKYCSCGCKIANLQKQTSHKQGVEGNNEKKGYKIGGLNTGEFQAYTRRKLTTKRWRWWDSLQDTKQTKLVKIFRLQPKNKGMKKRKVWFTHKPQFSCVSVCVTKLHSKFVRSVRLVQVDADMSRLPFPPIFPKLSSMIPGPRPIAHRRK